jgi:hypothetical protein
MDFWHFDTGSRIRVQSRSMDIEHSEAGRARRRAATPGSIQSSCRRVYDGRRIGRWLPHICSIESY